MPLAACFLLCFDFIDVNGVLTDSNVWYLHVWGALNDSNVIRTKRKHYPIVLKFYNHGVCCWDKTSSRKQVLQNYSKILHSPKFSILSAMYMLKKAWDDVSNQTFTNCFRKSGISQKDAAKAINEEDDPFKAVGGGLGSKFEFFSWRYFDVLHMENQMLFTEFKNLYSFSRYLASKWPWFSVFSRKIGGNRGGNAKKYFLLIISGPHHFVQFLWFSAWE